MINKRKIMDDVLPIIAHYFGNRVAKSYSSFYDSKSDAKVLKACRRMLSELLGPRKAEMKLVMIYEKYGIRMVSA